MCRTAAPALIQGRSGRRESNWTRISRRHPVLSITLNLTNWGLIFYRLILGWLNVDNGTLDYLYYVNGSGITTFTNAGLPGNPGAGNTANGGLSGIELFGTQGATTTPMAAPTIGLLGLAFAGLR